MGGDSWRSGYNAGTCSTCGGEGRSDRCRFVRFSVSVSVLVGSVLMGAMLGTLMGAMLVTLMGSTLVTLTGTTVVVMLTGGAVVALMGRALVLTTMVVVVVGCATETRTWHYVRPGEVQCIVYDTLTCTDEH